MNHADIEYARQRLKIVRRQIRKLEKEESELAAALAKATSAAIIQQRKPKP